MKHKEQVDDLLAQAKRKFATKDEIFAYLEGRKDQLTEDHILLTKRNLTPATQDALIKIERWK